MNMKSLLLTTAFFALAGPALAQQAPMPGQPAPAPAPGQGQRQSPFERMDTNNDGVLTRDEVRAARTVAFTRLDINGDGFLVREEMAAARGMMRQAGGPNGMAEGGRPRGDHGGGGNMLERADTNNDGNISRAEFDAAGRAAESLKEQSRGQRRTAMFARFDTNSDGVISAAEIAAMRAARPERGGPQAGMPAAGGRGGLGPDTNNDQKVSLAEWLARPDPLFDRGDANKDGRVTREEAAAIVRQGRGQNGRLSRPW
jgi:Ca2+-binding EF-hand superfamily protein